MDISRSVTKPKCPNQDKAITRFEIRRSLKNTSGKLSEEFFLLECFLPDLNMIVSSQAFWEGSRMDKPFVVSEQEQIVYTIIHALRTQAEISKALKDDSCFAVWVPQARS